MDVVVKARHCTVSDQFRSYVDEKITRLRSSMTGRSASRSRFPRSATSTTRSSLPSRNHPAQQGSGGPRRSRGGRQSRRVRHGARQADGPIAPGRRPQTGHREPYPEVTAGRGGRRTPVDEPAPELTERQAPVCRHRGRRRRPTGGPGENARRHADDAGPGSARDGTRRPRLLPFIDAEHDSPSVVYRRRLTTTGLSGWLTSPRWPPTPSESERFRSQPTTSARARSLAAMTSSAT